MRSSTKEPKCGDVSPGNFLPHHSRQLIGSLEKASPLSPSLLITVFNPNIFSETPLNCWWGLKICLFFPRQTFSPCKFRNLKLLGGEISFLLLLCDYLFWIKFSRLNLCNQSLFVTSYTVTFSKPLPTCRTSEGFNRFWPNISKVYCSSISKN